MLCLVSWKSLCARNKLWNTCIGGNIEHAQSLKSNFLFGIMFFFFCLIKLKINALSVLAVSDALKECSEKVLF